MTSLNGFFYSAQAIARPFPIPVNYFAMALGTGARVRHGVTSAG